MNPAPADARADMRATIIAWVLGILSFAAMLFWVALFTLGKAFANMGDGAPSGPSNEGTAFNVMIVCGFLYLCLVSFSCLPFMRGRRLLKTGIVAHLILATLVLLYLLHDGLVGFAALVPFAPFAGGWLWLYRIRRAKPDFNDI